MLPGLTILIRLTFVLYLITFTEVVVAQPDQFSSLKTYSKRSTELLSGLKEQTKSELDQMAASKERMVAKIYKSRLRMLLDAVERGSFIRNDTLEQVVQRVMDTLVARNTIQFKPSKILISRDVEVNAICFGEGTLILTLGLVSKIRNPDQLAFVLSHELAHFELEHVKKQIIAATERKIPENVKQQLENMQTDNITREGMEVIRDYLFSIGQFNRQREITADSLGFLYFKNAGFASQEAITLLNLLDSANAPKYGSAKTFFAAFNFSRYPFNEHWLERLSVYGKNKLTHFLVPLDSMKSHPDIQIRKSKLESIYKGETKPVSETRDIRLASTLADFEMIHATFISGRFDKCLYYALQLKTRFPKNTFINTTIGKILVTISTLKNKRLPLDRYVPMNTPGYGDDLRAVNNFLHNTNEEELSELAFYFLNHQDNFNPSDPESYRLLWKVCELTQRVGTKEKIKQLYIEKFPDEPPLREQ